jgi:hypothetical protein
MLGSPGGRRDAVCASEHADEVGGVRVADTFGDHVDVLVGVDEAVARLREAAGRDPLADGFAGRTLERGRDVCRRAFDGGGDVAQGDPAEAVALDESQRVADEVVVHGRDLRSARDLRE